MIKPIRNLYGYRNLLVYKKAEALQLACVDFISHFSHYDKTLSSLSDQMDRSARSTKQNITEGWKRNSTGEYYQFLGFAIASNAELEEDCTDIIKGVYGAKGLKGIDREEMGRNKGDERGEKRGIEWVESLPFYPLDPLLPLVIQLKLRAKELNFLLDKLQRSLAEKMQSEGTLSLADKLKIRSDQKKEEEIWYENMLKEQGFIRLENGQVVKQRGINGEKGGEMG